jgi:hypothetical protein
MWRQDAPEPDAEVTFSPSGLLSNISHSQISGLTRAYRSTSISA